MKNQLESDIMSRLVYPERDDLSTVAARALVRLEYDRKDSCRFEKLLAGHEAETLLPDEREELASYLRVDAFLDLMKARHSLATSP